MYSNQHNGSSNQILESPTLKAFYEKVQTMEATDREQSIWNFMYKLERNLTLATQFFATQIDELKQNSK